MPTLLRWNGYRFYFWSREPDEPPHVHVDGAEGTAKIWLETLNVAYYDGFKAKDVSKVVKKLAEHQAAFLEIWYAYFAQ